ncbi:MAG: TIGR04211 family SH3 domain-containing protein, partial [Pseudomonadales bacterium]
MKNTLKCLSVALLFSAAQSWAVDRYISDELFTYMHSGPSAQYRITGSINAGSKVTLLESNRGGGYSKVRDNRGRTGWVSTKFVTR